VFVPPVPSRLHHVYLGPPGWVILVIGLGLLVLGLLVTVGVTRAGYLDPCRQDSYRWHERVRFWKHKRPAAFDALDWPLWEAEILQYERSNKDDYDHD
jgi:hypothetical protein